MFQSVIGFLPHQGRDEGDLAEVDGSTNLSDRQRAIASDSIAVQEDPDRPVTPSASNEKKDSWGVLPKFCANQNSHLRPYHSLIDLSGLRG